MAKKTILSNTLNTVIKDYKRDLAKIHTLLLRSRTSDAGLQPAAANTLTVVPQAEQKNLKVTMAPQYKNDVYDFAYGKTGVPATPVIQSYLRGDL
jgi:hypothetical protein